MTWEKQFLPSRERERERILLDENACILLLITFTGLSSSTSFLSSSLLVDGRPIAYRINSLLLSLNPASLSPYFPLHPPPQSRPSPASFSICMHVRCIDRERKPRKERIWLLLTLHIVSGERELLWVFRITLNAMFCVSPEGKKLKAEAVDSIVFLLHWMTYDSFSLPIVFRHTTWERGKTCWAHGYCLVLSLLKDSRKTKRAKGNNRKILPSFFITSLDVVF